MATDRSDEQIRADLAAYERWNDPDLERDDREPTDSGAIGRLLADVPTLLGRAERAEAAVQRVREMCTPRTTSDTVLPHRNKARLVTVCAILAALDGTPDGEGQ